MITTVCKYIYKPDTVTLFTDHDNVQNKCTTSINKSIPLFKIKPSKALFVKVDTMLTHFQIKMRLGRMPPFNKLPTKLFYLFLEDAILESVKLLVSI